MVPPRLGSRRCRRRAPNARRWGRRCSLGRPPRVRARFSPKGFFNIIFLFWWGRSSYISCISLISLWGEAFSSLWGEASPQRAKRPSPKEKYIIWLQRGFKSRVWKMSPPKGFFNIIFSLGRCLQLSLGSSLPPKRNTTFPQREIY